MDGAFYLHSAVAIMTLVFAYFTIPETFNMSLEDIEKIYRTKGDNLLAKPLRSRKTSSASMISFYEMNSPYNKWNKITNRVDSAIIYAITSY